MSRRLSIDPDVVVLGVDDDEDVADDAHHPDIFLP